jgi:hypothetical protein
MATQPVPNKQEIEHAMKELAQRGILKKSVNEKKRVKIGTPKRGALIAQFVVDITNGSQYTIEQIEVDYVNSQISGNVLTLDDYNSPPNHTSGFQLGPCAGMQGYVIVVYDQGQPVLRFPDTGYMTAQEAQQIDPTKNGPCDDHWEIDITTTSE